jgi:hypothetical protein
MSSSSYSFLRASALSGESVVERPGVFAEEEEAPAALGEDDDEGGMEIALKILEEDGGNEDEEGSVDVDDG